MKRLLLVYAYLFCLLFSSGLLQAEGFAVGTLVMTVRGPVPVEQVEVGDGVIAEADSKIACFLVTHTINNVCDVVVRIDCDDDCVYAAPDQKMYVLGKLQWVNADELIPSDRLLCVNGGGITIDAINRVSKTQKMYALSIETSHLFCVGRHGILAHNIEPVMTTAGVMALSVLCPPAAAAVVIGEVAALLAVGLGTYCAYRKIQKDKERSQFVCDDVHSTDQNHGGCFAQAEPVQSVIECFPPVDNISERVQDRTIIVENSTKTDVILTDEVPRVNDAGCAFPVAIQEPSALCFKDAEKDTEGEKKRYDGPLYARTEDWIKDHPFGQKIKKNLSRSVYTNQGKRVFKVDQKIEDCESFNKGEYVVVDAMHQDHLEVFSKDKKWSHVANFDGTENIEKTKQGQKESRRPL